MTPTRAQLVLTVVISGIFGLLIGSFLNVVVYRVPRHLSVVRPGSHCPSCQTTLSPKDNVPVISWLVLRGHCRYCGTAISPRYPLVESANAVVFAGLAWALGPVGALVPLLVVAAAMLAAVAIDLDGLTVPGPVLWALLVGCAGLGVAALAGEGNRRIGWAAAGAVAGAVVAGGVLWSTDRPPDGAPADHSSPSPARRVGSVAAAGWCAGWLWPPGIAVAVGGMVVWTTVVALTRRSRVAPTLLAAAAAAGLVAVLAGGVRGGP